MIALDGGAPRTAAKLTPGLALMGWLAMSVAACAVGDDAKGEAVCAPITHLPFWRQEPELFGYEVDVDAAPIAFDAANRPYVSNGGDVVAVETDGQPARLDFSKSISKQFPTWDGKFQSGNFSESHLVFDADDDAYMLVNASRSNIHEVLLLHSRDHCRSWTVYPLCPGNDRTFAHIEHRDGNSELSHPPAIVVGDGAWDGAGMRLVVAEKREDGALKINPPVMVANEAYVIPVHSGGGNVVVSIKDKIHLFWAGGKPVPGEGKHGTPEYCRSYDRRTGELSKTVFLGFGGKGSPDNHNLPAVAVDSKGFLHVLLGAHHDQFKYMRSLRPDSVVDGWTEPEPIGTAKVGASGSYTYAGLACGRDDTLHVIARWAGDSYYFRLVHLRKEAGEDWEKHMVLVSPFKNMYSCWYHKMSIDRKNRLFCAYIYFGSQLNDEQTASFSQKFPALPNFSAVGSTGMRSPAIIMSDDNGSKWRLTQFQAIDSGRPQWTRPATAPVEGKTHNLPLQLLGQWGGAVNCGELVGDKMFLGIGSRLAVMDVANPADLRLIDQSALVNGNVRSIAVKGDHAYAGAGKRLVVFKFDKTFKPVAIADAELPGPAVKVAAHENYLFAACPSGLEVFDISVPDSLVPLMDWRDTKAYDVEIVEDRLYLAAGEDGVRIFAIETAGRLKLIGSLLPTKGDSATFAYSVTVSGNCLYVGSGSPAAAIRVCDISNPAKPKEISRIERPTWSWGRKVLVDGRYAYYPASDAMSVLDISSPGAIKFVGEIPMTGDLTALAGKHGVIYALTGSHGVKAIDVSDATKPLKLAEYAEPLCPWGISVEGTRALLTDWKRGLCLVDVGAPSKPMVLGVLEKAPNKEMEQRRSMFRAAIKGDYALLAAGQEGLWIVDISKPERMATVKKITFAGGVRDVVVKGDVAFAAEAGAGVRILDVSDMNAPTTLGFVKSEREVLSLAVSNQYLFVGQAMWGGCAHLLGYDVADIKNPRKVMDLAIDNDVWGLGASGKFLYAAKANEGVDRFDISTIDAPKYSGTINTHNNVWDVCVSGKTIYFANGNAGLFYAEDAPPQKK